jgi:hypothetical protein
LVLAIDSNSPFYPEPIYQAVDAFRARAHQELSRLETREPFTSAWFDERDAARGEVVSLAERVSSAIRNRLGSLLVRQGRFRPHADSPIDDKLVSAEED